MKKRKLESSDDSEYYHHLNYMDSSSLIFNSTNKLNTFKYAECKLIYRIILFFFNYFYIFTINSRN